MDFEHMTADQIRDYEGNVFFGRLQWLGDDGRMYTSDHESTSEDGLRVKMLAEARTRKAWKATTGPHHFRTKAGVCVPLEPTAAE